MPRVRARKTDRGKTPLQVLKRAAKMVINREATLREATLHHQIPSHVTLS